MKNIIKLSLTILLATAYSFNALADEEKAKDKSRNFQMITSLSQTEGVAFKDKNRKDYLNSFMEYPLSKKASIGAISQLSYTDSVLNGGTQRYALNSVELFNRYKLFSYDKFGVTMHNSYKFQGAYNENKYLALMPKQDDYEFRLLVAHNMSDRLVNTVVGSGTPHFSRFEFAYRRRFSNPFDEVRFTYWGGFNINKTFAILAQDNITWNIQSKTNATSNSYSSFKTSKDANNMGTLSLIYRYSPQTAIQFGYIKRLHGNNPFYDNQGFVVGLWNSF